MRGAPPEGAVVECWSPSFAELKPSIPRIVRNLGYDLDAAPQLVAERLAELLDASRRFTQTVGGFVLLPADCVTVRRDSILAGRAGLSTGALIAGQLRGAETAALFAAGAGSAFDAWLSELAVSKDGLDHFLADAIGSELAELAADRVEDRLREVAASSGMSLSNRYSPGYCGWPVSDQHILFSLFPEGFCGIELNGSALMTPLKSVSGVIGIGPALRREEYDCGICDMQDCVRRRAG